MLSPGAAPKSIVVTGAGSGIGRAVSTALLERGHSVALIGRRKAMLEETAASASSRDRCAIVEADIRIERDVVSAFCEISGWFGRVDVLFNNAGIVPPATSLEEIDYDAWESAVSTNLNGTFLCTREAFRLMKSQSPQGGRIINNGSISAISPRPFSAAYTATKHAISGLTKSTSLDGRRFNIACSQIDIGNAATDVLRRMAARALQPDSSVIEEPMIDVCYVANAVVMIAELPVDVNVPSMQLIATNMPFVGRG